MGMFDFLKKNEKLVTDTNMFTDLTQTVAMAMYNAKITSMPGLQYLKEDGGVFERFANEEIHGSNIAPYKRSNPDLYIMILAAHAFGVGCYTVLTRDQILKDASKFSKADLERLIMEFKETDPYELCLNRLGFDVNSNNKAVLDSIISETVESEKELAKGKKLDEGNLKALMQVMFNAGVTMGLRFN